LTKCSLHLTYLLSDPKAGLPRICGQKTTHCRIFSCQKTCLRRFATSARQALSSPPKLYDASTRSSFPEPA